jgi:hypothetical protein
MTYPQLKYSLLTWLALGLFSLPLWAFLEWIPISLDVSLIGPFLVALWALNWSIRTVGKYNPDDLYCDRKEVQRGE